MVLGEKPGFHSGVLRIDRPGPWELAVDEACSTLISLAAGLIVTATHVPLGIQVLNRGIVFIDREVVGGRVRVVESNHHFFVGRERELRLGELEIRSPQFDGCSCLCRSLTVRSGGGSALRGGLDRPKIDQDHRQGNRIDDQHAQLDGGRE